MNMSVNVVQQKRNEIMSDENVKKIVDSFEQKAALSLRIFLGDHPATAFSKTFAFRVLGIDIAKKEWSISYVEPWNSKKTCSVIDNDDDETILFPRQECSSSLDRPYSRTLEKVFSEIESRGYRIGFEKSHDIPFVILVDID